MEASALSRASGRGLLARRSPLLRFEGDERLVALIRAGHDGAFEALFNRYNARLLAFCQSMLKSRQDAEDVLQEVFTNAHAAMLRDERALNVRPWLYRIARNRCLNHLRRPVPEGQDSMDIHPHANGTTTAEQVQHREELRQVLADVRTLPETQRTALLLREIDQLSYDEIAIAMQTTVPAIKSLLVRARIGLAESSKARMLTCEEVQVELAEAAEGIAKVTGPGRKHVRACESCRDFRDQLRTDHKALAALFPFGTLAMVKGGILSKLFGGGSAAGGSAGSAGVVGGASAAGGVSSVSGGIGILGGALGAKAAAGMATAALLTAGAVEVRNIAGGDSDPAPAPRSAPAVSNAPASQSGHAQVAQFVAAPAPASRPATPAASDQPAPDRPSADTPPAPAPAAPAEETEKPVEEPAAETELPADPAASEEVAIGAETPPGEAEYDPEAAPADPAEPAPTPTGPTPDGESSSPPPSDVVAAPTTPAPPPAPPEAGSSDEVAAPSGP